MAVGILASFCVPNKGKKDLALLVSGSSSVCISWSFIKWFLTATSTLGIQVGVWGCGFIL